jgi:hypothetical protein
MSGFVGDALFFTRVRALEVFYEQHSPELFDSAGSVLATFHGLESELFEHLRDQHSDEGLALPYTASLLAQRTQQPIRSQVLAKCSVAFLGLLVVFIAIQAFSFVAAVRRASKRKE